MGDTELVKLTLKFEQLYLFSPHTQDSLMFVAGRRVQE
jgi:hypothetical protein